VTTPVLFVHGLWLHATSWSPWVEFFDEAGYAAGAPGWPGDADTVAETRLHPEAVAGRGIDDVVAHYTTLIGALDEKPILIGHSFGGLIVQKLLGQGLASAAVAIDAAPFKGILALPVSALRVASIALRNPANRNRAVSLTADQFRYGFGNAISEHDSADLYSKWAVPSPGKPLFQSASANFSRHTEASVDTANSTRGPLLLTTGGKDHTVPGAITRGMLKQYKDSTAVTDLHEFPDRGHSLTIDAGWREIAEVSLAWLKKNGL
jgi:pimeloyl-ACP methyl ester carboxylesterase